MTVARFVVLVSAGAALMGVWAVLVYSQSAPATRPALPGPFGSGGPDIAVVPSSAVAPASQAAQGASAIIGWRGDGMGRFPDANPPTAWDADKKKGILWSVKVGAGRYSQPIVVGSKVFVVSEPDLLVCLDADSGKKLWEKATTFKDLPGNVEAGEARGDTGNTTPTPVSDGKFVYMTFGNGLLTCFDLEGKRRWIQYVEEPCPTEHGRSASPTLCGDKLIATMSCLRAFDVKSGKELWKCEKAGEVYGSPVIGRVGDTDVVIAASGHVVRVSDGALLSKGMGSATYASPSFVDGVAYFIDVSSLAVQMPDKAADQIKLKKLWEQDVEGEFFASAVVCNALVYAASNQGQLFVLAAADGKLLYKKDLEIPNASGAPGLPPGNVYPSVAQAGKYVFVSNDQGDTVVLQPGKQYKEVARNKLNEGHGGNMFFAGKRIYVRGDERLYCLGQ